MKIAFITPEALPFIKTGGLADISGVLPNIIAQMGHSVRVFLPLYRQIKTNFANLENTGIEITCEIADKKYYGNIFILPAKDSKPEIYFIENDYFFDREEPYRNVETGKDYNDNDERIIFFNMAILQALKKMLWPPDIIHCNDWQSSLIPSYLKTLYKDDSFFYNTRTVLTIHNLAYQGQFKAESFAKLGIQKEHFYPAGPFEYWGKINFLKSGIYYADEITTVSPTYAKEIQSAGDYGMGLEGVIKDKSGHLTGILNGVDYMIWSPKTDKLIPFRYFPANLSGKKKNKLEILKTANLPLRIEEPLIGMISRLDNQKGFDLLQEIMDGLLNLKLQFILLGTGDGKYHKFFKEMEKKYPDRIKAFLEFDNKLAHLISAGADIFLMPSRYEPCGLNQMYSLKYGTVPIIRKTGGLADTVVNFDEQTLRGTGFVFENYDSGELLETIKKAVGFYARKKIWFKIIKQGMGEDFSWDTSARKYEELYRALIK